jgi:hypothetical protein
MAIVAVTRYNEGYGKIIYDYCYENSIGVKGFGSINGLDFDQAPYIISNITDRIADCEYFFNYGYYKNQNILSKRWIDYRKSYGGTLFHFTTKTFNNSVAEYALANNCKYVEIAVEYDPFEKVDQQLESKMVIFKPNDKVIQLLGDIKWN